MNLTLEDQSFRVDDKEMVQPNFKFLKTNFNIFSVQIQFLGQIST